MKEEFERIVKMIGEVYDGKPWYGPSVKTVLLEVDEKYAGLKAGNSHTVIEIIYHMIAWRNYTTQVLEGNYSYDVTDELNFPEVTGINTIKEAIEQLDMSQVMLLKAISVFNESNLLDKVEGRKYNWYYLIQGIIHHDIYHLGQISLLKRILD